MRPIELSRKELDMRGIILAGSPASVYAKGAPHCDKKVFEFIEICFECDRTRESSNRVSLGTGCNQKLQLIRNYFKAVGINFGVTTGLMRDD